MRPKVSILFAALLLPGCDRAEITRYTIPKETVRRETSSEINSIESQTLAALVPHQDRVWFFKVLGAAELVSSKADAFRQFVGSVKFSDGRPEWSLPDGWSEIPADLWRHKPGASMRFATVATGTSEQPLELKISSLTRPEGDWDDYVLSNVNRWRAELGLPEIKIDELPQQLENIKLADGEAIVVQAKGASAPTRIRRAPFSATGASSEQDFGELGYEVPESWQPGELVASRGGITIRYAAAFKVEDGEQSLEITLSAFPASLAHPLRNINRWREQIGLGRVSQTELDEQLHETTVGGSAGHYIEMVGPQDSARREAILGVIAVHGQQVWFIKLRGDKQLAEREKENFKNFIQSLKFDQSAGVGHGER